MKIENWFHVQSGCEKGFVKCFLKVPLACLGSTTAQQPVELAEQILHILQYLFYNLTPQTVQRCRLISYKVINDINPPHSAINVMSVCIQLVSIVKMSISAITNFLNWKLNNKYKIEFHIYCSIDLGSKLKYMYLCYNFFAFPAYPGHGHGFINPYLMAASIMVLPPIEWPTRPTLSRPRSRFTRSTRSPAMSS